MATINLLNQSASVSNHSERRLTLSSSRKSALIVADAKVPVDIEVDIEVIKLKYDIDNFDSYTREEKEKKLSNFDALEMLETVEQLKDNLATINLENHVMLAFLEITDPRLLEGLNQILSISNFSSSMLSSFKSSRQPTKFSGSYARSSDQITKKVTDYKLNFKIKAEIAEKAKAIAEKRISEIERNSTKELKQLCAKIEDLRFYKEDTFETEKNFRLHFLRDDNDFEFLETATERQIERKMGKFMKNWLKSAHAMISSLCLTFATVHENCQQYRNELMVKSDLCGIVTKVDFEQLVNKRSELVNLLDEKNMHTTGLKKITAKAALELSEEKALIQNLERNLKAMHTKIHRVNQNIAKMDIQVNDIKLRYVKAYAVLEKLKVNMATFSAPDVNDYIMKKDELEAYQKDEILLKRKMPILHMKLQNVLKRYRSDCE